MINQAGRMISKSVIIIMTTLTAMKFTIEEDADDEEELDSDKREIHQLPLTQNNGL